MKFTALPLALPIIIIFLCTTHLCYAQDVESDFLSAHNLARSMEHVPPLTWNDTLAGSAQPLAESMASECQKIAQVPNEANVYIGPLPFDTGVDAVHEWVREKKYYNFITNNCDPGHDCGAYLKVVWGPTRMLGCAKQPCNNNNSSVAVCVYDPPRARPYNRKSEATQVVDGGNGAICSVIV